MTSKSQTKSISNASVSTHKSTVVALTASSKLKPDMVLEDVDSDNEGHHRRAPPSTVLTPPSPVTRQQQDMMQQTHCSSLPSQVPESVTKTSQEDAETQTGRWTPFIESIKKEAEDSAFASMEER